MGVEEERYTLAILQRGVLNLMEIECLPQPEAERNHAADLRWLNKIAPLRRWRADWNRHDPRYVAKAVSVSRGSSRRILVCCILRGLYSDSPIGMVDCHSHLLRSTTLNTQTGATQFLARREYVLIFALLLVNRTIGRCFDNREKKF